jgi:hypothetical protein
MSRRLLLPLAACAAVVAGAALAAAPPERIRGTVASVTDQMLTLRTDSGSDVPITLTGTTGYGELTASSLDAIKPDTFIGTATKSVGTMQVALEVVVFPNAMRGTGEGHYPWDQIRDTTLSGDATTTSAMTNGTVKTEAPAPGQPTTSSTMTNGTVASTGNASGARQLIVTYKGGQQTIIVPPTAPIVAVAPGKRSDLTPGAKVLVVATRDGNQLTALRINIGMNGLRPPM